MSLKKPQRSLNKWTKQKWRYSSSKESSKPKSKRGRYLPSAAWDALSPGEKRATNAAKRKTSKSGKQHSKQPTKIAKKVRKYRK